MAAVAAFLASWSLTYVPHVIVGTGVAVRLINIGFVEGDGWGCWDVGDVLGNG